MNKENNYYDPMEDREAGPVSTLADAFLNTESLAEYRMKPRLTRAMSGIEWLSEGLILGNQLQLCGPLWYEGELCVLFADTNIGKSLLAVQIADMVSRGCETSSSIPELRPQTTAQPVIYADFELSARQFARRYSSVDDNGRLTGIHGFSPNFVRVELSYDPTDDENCVDTCASKSFSDTLVNDIEKHIMSHGAMVVIIDNITFMAQGTEVASDALPMMKKLIALKKKHGLSILLLAHTPKRNLSNTLTRNDLQGSKMIINFVDSAFAIGESIQGRQTRYIKQIKQRNTELVYGTDSVLTCTIERITPEFVGFRSTGLSPEEAHLRPAPRSRSASASRRDLVREMLETGKNHKEIAAELGVHISSVYRLDGNGK